MNNKSLLLLLAFAAVVVVGVIGYGDFGETIRQLAGFPLTHLLAALALSLLNYLLRFARWSYYLNVLDVKIPPATSALVFLSGLAMSITPGKVGGASSCARWGTSNRPSVDRDSPRTLARSARFQPCAWESARIAFG